MMEVAPPFTALFHPALQQPVSVSCLGEVHGARRWLMTEHRTVVLKTSWLLPS
jgi:hypothetical protein